MKGRSRGLVIHVLSVDLRSLTQFYFKKHNPMDTKYALNKNKPNISTYMRLYMYAW